MRKRWSSNESQFYARKLLFAKTYHEDTWICLADQNEAPIIRRLNHRHIVQVVSTHRLANNFAIIMLPVAEKNFADLLDEIDQMKEGVEKTANLERMAGCLIQATNYMRLSHQLVP